MRTVGYHESSILITQYVVVKDVTVEESVYFCLILYRNAIFLLSNHWKGGLVVKAFDFHP